MPSMCLGSNEGQRCPVWCEQDMAPRARGGQGLSPVWVLAPVWVPSTGMTLTNWWEVRGDHGDGGAGALVLQGEAAGPGLVQLGRGVTGDTQQRPWYGQEGMEETQPGSSQACTAGG